MAGNMILQTIKSPWPANNVRRRNEPVATDTIKAQAPAVDDGSTMAQLFIGRKSLISDAYGVKNRRSIRQHPQRQHALTRSNGQAHQQWHSIRII